MEPEAVAILKTAQPTDTARRRVDGSFADFHRLDILNRLRNKDTHSRLVALIAGLGDPDVTYITEGGNPVRGKSNVEKGQALGDGAEFIPPATGLARIVDVQAKGTALVGIRIGQNEGWVVLPGATQNILETVRALIARLAPYTR